MSRFFCLCTSVLIIFFFHSCSSSNPQQKTKKETLCVNLPEEPTTMDPRKGGDVCSSAMHFLLFEGLTKITSNSSGDYGIAYKIDLSKDNLTYTFHLRDSVWSDNTPLTAHDFEYSWKSMLDPSFPSPCAILLYPILHAEEAKKGEISLDNVGIKALDNNTLVVTLKSPTPYFLNITSFCALFPVSKSNVEKHPDWSDNFSPTFISNGPYRLAKWKHHDEIVLEKNPAYWDKEDVDLKGIHVSLIDSENTVLEMFENKELDILGSPFTNIPIDAAEALKHRELINAHPVGKTLSCFFNVQRPILNNKSIRKALSLAIDRSSIVETVGVMGEFSALNCVPPILKNGRNIALIEPSNIILAKHYFEKGLEELNISAEDFNQLVMIYPSKDIFCKIAQILQNQWQKHLGITIQLRAIDYKTFISILRTGDFDICESQFVAQYDDPMNILDRFKNSSDPKNYSKWENNEYSHLLNISAFLSGKEREDVLDKAEAILMDELPLAPIMHSSSIRMVQPYVKGISTSSIGLMHLHKIHFEDEGGEVK